jgi:hypothetical protein
VKSVCFEAPSGAVCERPVFIHQPARLEYDDHGYEQVVSVGERTLSARFTPTEVGTYLWKAVREDNSIAEQGSFLCTPTDHSGYVRVSQRDSRYFETSEGESFCVIGLNLCLPPSYPLSAGSEFQTSDQRGTLGLLDYHRWFREFSGNGGNFIRLWLSTPYFEPETEAAGELSLEKFARLDGLVELARRYGIRLKFCLEHFRTIGPIQIGWSEKALKHPVDGVSPASMDEWFTDEKWQALWWKKINAYVARYGGDPTVMAWELWNEINACSVSDWGILRDWTANTAKQLQSLVPQQLVVNSLGSFDRSKWKSVYDDFHMDELAFQQVHRYLDHGAELEVCYDAFRLGIDAIQMSRRPDKPVLLAETGAVNDDHTGPFAWYRADHRGLIFHDTVYPSIFAGAAGIGQIWHWDEYVDKKNLWPMFQPIHSLMAGIDLPAEKFEPFEIDDDRLSILGLKGSNYIVGMVRVKGDDWRRLYLNHQSPQVFENIVIDLSGFTTASGQIELISPWERTKPQHTDLHMGQFAIPRLEISCFYKIRLK